MNTHKYLKILSFVTVSALMIGQVGCGRTYFFMDISKCGNGEVEAGEECDDGNESDADACLSSCKLNVCGDNHVLVGHEECDDGNLNDGDGCDADCQEEERYCGDGIVDPEFGEECDDGNNVNDDGCDANCHIESLCGNGIVDFGEECDDGNFSNEDSCLSWCQLARCGDSYVWFGVEQCDDGNTLPGDGCSVSCFFEGVTCGNGIIEPGEDCDDGNVNNTDGCLASCQNARCGDGFLWTGVEQCDDGNLVNGDGCSTACLFEGATCGNGVLEPGEQCDDGDFDNSDDCLNSCRIATCGDSFIWTGMEMCDDGNTLPNDGCSPFCELEVGICGNGIVEGTEECDDGNFSSNDACLATCRRATCGDAWVYFGVEQCDDGNNVNGDGCDMFCLFEGEVCGNGIVETGEDCDDGNFNNNDACLNTCRAAACGDGVVWLGTEQCDDGNNLPNDGCSPFCTLEGTICGNGVMEPGEQCDDGNFNNNDACLSTCQNASCGDSFLWFGMEQCDDGNTMPGDGCNMFCQFETAVCGNAITEPGEECDDGNLSNNDACLSSCQNAECGDFQIWFGVEQCDDGNTMPGDGCDDDCRIESVTCGNGVIEPGEQCDDGNFSNNDACLNTCQDAACGDGYWWLGTEQCDDGNNLPNDGCSPMCTLETGSCGNGVNEPGEQCDDGNFSNNDGCLNTCLNAACGDGFTWFGVEECDDGNTTPGDGCSPFCTAETAFCGNGVTEPGEQCDDGNFSNTDSCLNTCQNAACGDSYIWINQEECDDGNTTPGDGCDASCSTETPTCVPDWSYLACGGTDWWTTELGAGSTDNIDSYPCTSHTMSGPEYTYTFEAQTSGQVTVTLGDTDPGQNLDLLVLGYGGGVCEAANCLTFNNSQVTWNAVAGQTYFILVDGRNDSVGNYSVEMVCAQCGNGAIDPGEDCDDGNTNNNDACLDTCQNATCGDGFWWTGVEQCDDGNTVNGDGCSAICQIEASVCGNGIPEPGEQCDDGNTSNNDACLATCQLASCGDGFLWSGVEQCDDGNTTVGDGCDASCQLEVAVCGNGIPEPGEQCDDGNTSNNDACLNSCRVADCGDSYIWFGIEQCDDGNTSPGDGCDAVCQIEVAVCGNGIPEAGEECDDGNPSSNDACLTNCQIADCGDSWVWFGMEQCDDGNTASGDGCSATCQLEATVCGNGIPEAGEECDDGNLSNNDACLATCVNAQCGDTFLWGGVEQCDDGNTTPGDGCSATCQLETAVCGNGIPEAGEECDDGNTSNTDACLTSCQDAECGDSYVRAGVEQCDDGNTTSGDGCSATCQLETSVCGNGIPETGEECDDGNLSNTDACLASCHNATCGDTFLWNGVEQCDDGNTTPGDGCSATCQLETAVCGNGIPEIGEECDDGNLSDTDACTSSCQNAECGDGFIWGGVEQCDDGNTLPGDGCDANCMTETTTCGNGIPETGEDCDDGNLTNSDACLNTCVAASCGDGYIWINQEECDDGNSVNGDGCDVNCQLENPTCVPDWAYLFCNSGDTYSTSAGGATDVVDSYPCTGRDESGPEYTYTFTAPESGEVTVEFTGMDPGIDLDLMVLSYGGGICAPENCIAFGDNQVTWDAVAGNTYFILVDGVNGDEGGYSVNMTCPGCGNGIPEAGEQCDDGNFDNLDGCLNTCVIATCGDGFVWAGMEQCDDGNTANGDGCDATCQYENPMCEPDWTLACGGSDSYSNEYAGATDAVDNYSCTGLTFDAPEYTYTFTSPADQQVTVDLISPNSELDLLVLTDNGGLCDPTNCLAYGNSQVIFQASAGQTYYIVVDGRNGALSTFTVALNCSDCGNGLIEAGEDCDDGPANETRYGLTAWQTTGFEMQSKPVERWMDAYSFYGFTSASAHTGYEAVGRSVIFLYRDWSTGILSLFTVHGIDEDTSGQYQPTAELEIYFRSLPPGTTLNRGDEPNEFSQISPTEYHGDYWFQANTDGAAISDIAFPAGWTIEIEPIWNYGLTEWVLVDDNDQLHSLDMSVPLYITADANPVSCREDCTAPECGDDILDPGEVCDDGNTSTGDGCAADCMSVP
jgi:cysteine-rich repeat protein